MERATRITPGVRDLMMNLSLDDRPYSFAWAREDKFSPRWYRRTLEAAERGGWIEIDRRDSDMWLFRLTGKAKSKLESEV